jgi:hypothetical protein
MEDSLRLAMEQMQAKLQEKLNEAADLKKAINVLCTVMHVDPLYPDVEAESASGSVGPLRADIYYGKPLSTAVREHLERRKHAMSVEDILRGLEAGGFDFEEAGWSPTNRLRNLSITLSKNTAMFKRLPNGMIGVKAWYVESKRKTKGKAAEADSNGDADVSSEETAEAVAEGQTAAKEKGKKATTQEEKGSTADTAEPEVTKATA